MGNGFQMVPLGELLIPISRPEPTILEKQYSILGTHWYAQGLYIKNVKLGSEIQADRVYRVEEGDFVYNRLFAWKGSFALALKTDDGCYVSNEFPCFRVKEDIIDVRYLWKYFSRSSAWNEALGLSSGGTPTSRNRLKEEKLLEMEIPLPPLEDQRRIIARIEELAARIEEARGLRREAVKESEVLLSETITQALDNNSWEKSTLGSLLRENSRNGLSAYPSDNPSGTPILRISAATSRQDAIIDEQDHKYMELDEPDILKYRLEPGDLLACRFNGNLHYVGRFALYTGYLGQTQVYPDKLIRFRVDIEKALPEFVRYVVNSPIGRKPIEAFSATTAGNIGISAGDLKTITIPVPPLSEQHRIVTYLDSLQTKVDSLKQLQSETSAELDALLPSILDKAFKGEL